jgi:hypothetical protein
VLSVSDFGACTEFLRTIVRAQRTRRSSILKSCGSSILYMRPRGPIRIPKCWSRAERSIPFIAVESLVRKSRVANGQPGRGAVD